MKRCPPGECLIDRPWLSDAFLGMNPFWQFRVCGTSGTHTRYLLLCIYYRLKIVFNLAE